MNIRLLEPGQHCECEAILRSLPDWFGVEESLLQYVMDAGDTEKYQTAFAVDFDRVAGFVTLRRHFLESAEIHCLAVRPEFHRTGVGRSLVAWAEDALRIAGTRVLQVKTMGPSRPCEFYARTLAFYRAVGFLRLEEFHGLWGRIPCLVLVKVLD